MSPPAPDAPDARGPRILTVCTGNLCRSPLAALLLERGLEGTGIEVSSAGTHAPDGLPMTPRARAVAIRRGVARSRAEAHRSRPLDDDAVRSADLILAMDRAHRRAVVERCVAARDRTFTLRELARLAAAVPRGPEGAVGGPPDVGRPAAGPRAEVPTPERPLAEVVARLALSRGRVPPPDDPAEDDVADPYRRSRWVYARTGRQIAPAVDEVLRLLRPAP